MSKTICEKACSVAFDHWKREIDNVDLALESVRIWRKNRDRFRIVYRMHLDALNALNPSIQKLKELVAAQSF